MVGDSTDICNNGCIRSNRRFWTTNLILTTCTSSKRNDTIKTIDTLVTDIQYLLTTRGWFTDELALDLSNNITKRLQSQYNYTYKPSLRMSKLGPVCPKALWHSIHTPELAEPLPPWAEFKYSFGHIIEAQAIALAKASGHTVTGEQDELVLDGIRGHRDCIIDGYIVDVKSSSSRGMDKFKRKDQTTLDDWGYLSQLDAYMGASINDDLVLVKDKACLLIIDKQLGHMLLYEHTLRKEFIKERIRLYKSYANSIQAPRCTCKTVPEGRSGNIGLDTKASYSAYKNTCFPGLRTFLYSDGPKYLTHVERKPDVIEINRAGQVIH